VLEWVDQLLLWREGWIEWAIAAVALPALGVGAWALSQPGDSHTSVLTILPQTIGAVLLFPAILRLTAALDTWRLKR
jgi:rod shape-determining protein MreD